MPMSYRVRTLILLVLLLIGVFIVLKYFAFMDRL